MKKRTFLIPLSGVALAGCGDPIIATWEGIQYDGYALPYIENYVNANGANCVSTYTINMTIEDNLTGTLDFLDSTVCDDGTNTNYADSNAFNVTVVDKKKQYTIDVSGDILTCNMTDKVDLSCDLDGQVGIIKFKAVE